MFVKIKYLSKEKTFFYKQNLFENYRRKIFIRKIRLIIKEIYFYLVISKIKKEKILQHKKNLNKTEFFIKNTNFPFKKISSIKKLLFIHLGTKKKNSPFFI